MVPHESPDMKFARDRLGNLLTSIRQGEAPWLNPMDRKPTVETVELRRGPGRPRKVQSKDKQVVFELRGKPFGLRDGHTDSMYQLCRAWMRGKASEPCEPQQPAPPPVDTSLVRMSIVWICILKCLRHLGSTWETYEKKTMAF
ncbi:hypothetical protein COOONC_26487 [Cooperia oncophora]